VKQRAFHRSDSKNPWEIFIGAVLALATLAAVFWLAGQIDSNWGKGWGWEINPGRATSTAQLAHRERTIALSILLATIVFILEFVLTCLLLPRRQGIYYGLLCMTIVLCPVYVVIAILPRRY
jgi:hypothetical protein